MAHPRGRFDALRERQFVTESTYINSLANLAYRSTIKTLPATLPELRARFRGPPVRAPRSTDRGCRYRLLAHPVFRTEGAGLLGGGACALSIGHWWRLVQYFLSWLNGSLLIKWKRKKALNIGPIIKTQTQWELQKIKSILIWNILYKKLRLSYIKLESIKSLICSLNKSTSKFMTTKAFHKTPD